ncbi:MAG: HAD-IIIA family hydrolase [Nitrospiraceae bacterium]|jgi:3-deoxy-D-manno-octulosonate 8-phosphate phosphatase (KDO 8-P phosphatase)|nr:MAG: HAD-IIIA family hydrolase [Nitrospiraceae bacterium]
MKIENKARRTKSARAVKALAGNIKMLILDVDGVLTDGSIILDNEGNEYKSFHVRDGHGIKMLIHSGIKVAIITGRHSKVVERRAHELGITEVFQKCHDKRVAYRKLIGQYSLEEREVAYIGDDIVDAPIMSMVGLPVAVADATEETKGFALLVTKNRGGRGAVREVADFILKAKGIWQRMLDDYFKD